MSKRFPKPSSPEQDLSRKRLGDYGERKAAEWYEAAGYDVVARQWRIRNGELDLVLRREETLVFCEVKTRSSDRFGTGLEAVTYQKQQHLRHSAMLFLQAYDEFVPKLRFDVAVVTKGQVTVLQNAF